MPLSRITAWLYRVWSALIACLADAGIAVPEDLAASRYKGDDDLPWPAERLHYHWSIPTVEEQAWPRENEPEDVAAVLSMLLANRRARDSLD